MNNRWPDQGEFPIERVIALSKDDGDVHEAVDIVMDYLSRPACEECDTAFKLLGEHLFRLDLSTAISALMITLRSPSPARDKFYQQVFDEVTVRKGHSYAVALCTKYKKWNS